MTNGQPGDIDRQAPFGVGLAPGGGAAMAAAAAASAAAMTAQYASRPVPDQFQYLVQDYYSSATTADLQEELNKLGASGWQLLFVNQINDTLRAWYIKSGAAPPPPPPATEEAPT